ncbi:hypothetical protein COS75_02300 [Candidatus Pacearchaeota archaeon CG06_land_8_20_14_3_00_35_12]|nr:MAG: hypothetical protein COS75_02300 [Candidatus Pacearchaeota archaeon CG06_land_8_20_14_3_00_35_12]
MNLKIISQKHNPLLQREEVKGIITNEKTVSKAELQKEVAEHLKKSEELIAIKTIYPAFGSDESEFEVYVYNSPEAKTKIEPKIKAKTGAPAKKAEAQAPAQAAAPAKPAETAKKIEEKK